MIHGKWDVREFAESSLLNDVMFYCVCKISQEKSLACGVASESIHYVGPMVHYTMKKCSDNMDNLCRRRTFFWSICRIWKPPRQLEARCRHFFAHSVSDVGLFYTVGYLVLVERNVFDSPTARPLNLARKGNSLHPARARRRVGLAKDFVNIESWWGDSGKTKNGTEAGPVGPSAKSVVPQTAWAPGAPP